jgi:hypothetical protein
MGRPSSPRWWRQGRSGELPLGRLLLYYAGVVLLAWLLIDRVPVFEHALLAPIDAGVAETIFEGGDARAAEAVATEQAEPAGVERGITTLIVAFGALLLTLPAAWVYMFTRRLRYDPSLVQSVIVLPLLVSGIVVVVKHSLALAFSLAGIVAVVRFRNTLKDPKDAVYVFLALGIGLAAGVQALDIALVMSLTFNVIILLLWKFNVGSIYSGVSADRSVLSVGNPKLLTVREQSDRERVKAMVADVASGMEETDGVLLVHSRDAEAARRALEVSLSRLTSEWRMLDEGMPGRKGNITLVAVVSLEKKVDPAEVLGEIDERWAPYIAAAEFMSLRTHEVSWDGRERREDGDG